MAGIKRKQPVVTSAYANGDLKKSKVEPKKVRKSARPPTPPSEISELEAETDSDPIIESDTTEQSGDDDGVSWPSDDKDISPPAPKNEGVKLPILKTKSKTLGGGVKLATAQLEQASKEGVSTDDAKGTSNSTSSREAHAKQKVVAQERKAAKPNADSIARAKKLWERLRIQSKVPKEERRALVAELFEIITGRVKDFVLKHDSGRVIQTAIKYGSQEQRKMIARELKGDYRTLAESRYAKFMVGKLLVHGDEEIRDLVVPEFYGHVRRMIKHPEAAWILDDVYRGAATPKQKAVLLREWYGAEFAIFRASTEGGATSDLKTILEQNPGKRAPIMRSLFELINQLVQKRTIAFTMLHDAMLQYYLNVVPGSEEALEFVELLKGDEEGDLLKNLAFTKSGARLVCLVFAYSSAKDRKLLLKVYKNTMQALAYDSNGHQVLLAAYETIDDTVLTAKSIFSEFPIKDARSGVNDEQADPITSITHSIARIPILYLFVAKPQSLLPVEDIALLKEIYSIRITTSKKDPEIRRKELARALAPSLLSCITTHATTLITTPFGCQFISEVLLSAEGDKTSALEAVAALTQEPPDIQAFLETPAASRMWKALALGGRFNQMTKKMDLAEPPLKFSDTLYQKIKGDVVAWMTGPNAFVVVGLLESADFSYSEDLKATARINRTKLQKVADGGKVVDGRPDGEKEKAREAGRKGTKMLLGMIDS